MTIYDGYSEHYDATARLTILRALANETDYRLNDTLLMRTLEAFAIKRGRGYLRGIEDIGKARKPLYTTGGEERSGMGFTIMESFMDKLTVRSTPGEGTSVIMLRTLPRRVRDR